jgi:hypothetical protein
MQIGDLDRLWDETIDNPSSPYKVPCYNCDGVEEQNLTNYFLVAKRNKHMFLRYHQLFLKLWGGKTSTEGQCSG